MGSILLTDNDVNLAGSSLLREKLSPNVLSVNYAGFLP